MCLMDRTKKKEGKRSFFANWILKNAFSIFEKKCVLFVNEYSLLIHNVF